MKRRHHFAIGICLQLCSTAWIVQAAETPKAAAPDKPGSSPDAKTAAKPSMMRGEDGKFDVSNFLDQAYGFLPVVVPITEPAVGAGAVVALAFLDRPKNEDGGFNRPNITVIGGLGTENGTEGYFGADIRYWMDNRLRTMVGGIKSNVHLDYYGSGKEGFLNRNPQSYTLDIKGATAKADYRLGDSQNWLGMNLLTATTSVSFGDQRVLPLADRETNIAGIGFSFTHDTRDNIFTPREGNYFEAAATIFSDALGSDLDFKRYSLTGLQYRPLSNRTSIGFREMYTANSGDTPFYMQPYVYMRGVPAMRYMGEKVAQVEAEIFWRGWDRVALIGFIGAGAAAGKIRDFETSSTVVAGGAGVRYEVARKYGLFVGADAAWSRDGPAIYIQVGSAWMHP
jgi:hypothetical protein